MTDISQHDSAHDVARRRLRLRKRGAVPVGGAAGIDSAVRGGPLGLGRDAASWAEDLLEVTRYEVARADDKANTLFRFYGVVAALSIGLLAGQGWSPSALTGAAQALLGVGAAAFLASGVLLGMVLYPRKRAGDGSARLLYFGHVLGYSTPAELAGALRAVEGDVDARVVEQLFALSRLADRKFQYTRGALLTLLLGTVLTIAAALADTIAA